MSKEMFNKGNNNPFAERLEKFKENYASVLSSSDDLILGVIDKVEKLEGVEKTFKGNTEIKDVFIFTIKLMEDKDTPMLDPQEEKPFAVEIEINKPGVSPDNELFKNSHLYKFTKDLGYSIPKDADGFHPNRFLGAYLRFQIEVEDRISKKGTQYKAVKANKIMAVGDKFLKEKTVKLLASVFADE